MIIWRHYSIVGVFLLAVILLSGRVLYLSYGEREFLQQQGDARSVRHEDIPALRGVIYDRNHEALAVSTPVFAVWTDPSKAKFSKTDIARIAEYIDASPMQIDKRLAENSGRKHVYLRRRVSWNTAQDIRRSGIEHLYLDPEYKRYYPAAETAAHLVGFTDVDDKGMAGSEKAFQSALQGNDGAKVVLRDRLGNTIRNLEYISAPEYGQDLVLSIDLRLQYIAYRELKSAVASHNAQSGSLIMLDVESGEVLAMVNQPSYNPNNIVGVDGGMRNRSILDAYEPGSTIKPFTALAAIESGRYNLDTPINTAPGYFWVGRKLIQDPLNRKVITLGQAIQKSSQVAIAKVALDLEENAVYDVLQRAGLGIPVGTGLPGEAMGYINDTELRYPVVRTSFSYGYGLSVTPLQLAQAYLTLADGGVRKPISILKGGGANGVLTANAKNGERVFTQQDTAAVLRMMEMVTQKEGTATAAAVADYRVAGKTGTVRKVGPEGYDDTRHVVWFAGIAPVSQPKVVMVVMIDEPNAGLSGGGTVAAPVFSRVATRSLRLLGVEPDGISNANSVGLASTPVQDGSSSPVVELAGASR